MNAWGVDLQPPRFPTSMTRAPRRTWASTRRSTRSSTSTASAVRSTRAAFSVSNSGSPGPAPTSHTFPRVFSSLVTGHPSLWLCGLLCLPVIEKLKYAPAQVDVTRVGDECEALARSRQIDLENVADRRLRSVGHHHYAVG